MTQVPLHVADTTSRTDRRAPDSPWRCASSHRFERCLVSRKRRNGTNALVLPEHNAATEPAWTRWVAPLRAEAWVLPEAPREAQCFRPCP